MDAVQTTMAVDRQRQVEPLSDLSDFDSLVQRSITAWGSMAYANLEIPKAEAFDKHSNALRRFKSLDELLLCRGYWFFQRRASFMGQALCIKWSAERLDEYILLPMDYGFANNSDCVFVSHYWRTKQHPDPEGDNLRIVKGFLEPLDWSYIWLDWTCMPQHPRTPIQSYYFQRSLEFIPVVIRDCTFMWHFPSFQPRAWVLFEVAEFILNHSLPGFIPTEDMQEYVRHIMEMFTIGVKGVLEKYGYTCTNGSDLLLVTSWLELLTGLRVLLPGPALRQEIFDCLNQNYSGSLTYLLQSGAILKIDKINGLISYLGATYRFTPLPLIFWEGEMPLIGA